ncbi:MAG: hypothetical protein ACFS26_00300 [Candidatus Karelsulcia muelleri]
MISISKFGKTEKGDNIWIDPNLTSPYEFYQKNKNLRDNLLFGIL